MRSKLQVMQLYTTNQLQNRAPAQGRSGQKAFCHLHVAFCNSEQFSNHKME